MKKSFRALVATLLCLTMLLPNALSVYAWPPENDADLIDLDDNFVGLIEDSLNASAKALEKVDPQKAAQVLNQMSTFSQGFSQFVKFVTTASYFTSFFNGSIAILRMFGIMEDPTQAALARLEDCVKSIQQTVEQIDRKVDDLKSTMVSEFAEMRLNFDSQSYDAASAAWESFYNSCVKELDSLMDEFSESVNLRSIAYARAWQESDAMDLRALYGDDGKRVYAVSNLRGPGEALHAAPTESVEGLPVDRVLTLPGSYIYGAINRSVNVNADNLVTVLTETLSAAVLAAADAGELEISGGSATNDSAAFYAKWNGYNAAQKRKAAAELAEELLDSLSFTVAHTVVNSANYASRVRSAARNYSNYLNGREGLSSPVAGQLKMLSLTHGFEGEVKADVESLYAYFSLMNVNFAGFVMTVLSFSDGITSSDRESVRTGLVEAQGNIYTACKNFITGNNNYCYAFGRAVEYRNVTVTSKMWASCEYACNGDDPFTVDPLSRFDYNEDFGGTVWMLRDDSLVYSENETTYWQQVASSNTALQQTMISSSEAALLYAIFRSRGAGFGDFYTYLTANNAALPLSAERTEAPYGLRAAMLTAGGRSEDFNLGTGVYMPYVFPANEICDYFKEGDKVTVNVGNDSDVEDEYFVIHDQYVSDTLDMTTGKLTVNASLAARALYGESHMLWSIDELHYFSNVPCEYNPKISYQNSEHTVVTCTPEVICRAGYCTLVTVPAKTATVPADVVSVGSAAFGEDSGIRQLTILGNSTDFAPDAFKGIGSEEKRCLLIAPDMPELAFVDFAQPWNGGWFANTLALCFDGYDDYEGREVPAALGAPCRNIACPFAPPEGMVFSHWETVMLVGDGYQLLVADDLPFEEGMYLTAVYEPKPVVIPGDVNGDGVLSILDVTELLRVLGGGTPLYDSSVYDMNGDAAISIQDVTKLLRMLAVQ